MSTLPVLMDQSLLSTLESADEPILLSTAVALLLLSVVHAVDAAACQLIMQLTLLPVQLLTQMMLLPAQLLTQMMLLPVQLLMQMLLLPVQLLMQMMLLTGSIPLSADIDRVRST